MSTELEVPFLIWSYTNNSIYLASNPASKQPSTTINRIRSLHNRQKTQMSLFQDLARVSWPIQNKLVTNGRSRLLHQLHGKLEPR